MGSRSPLTVVSALVPALERFAIMTFERTGIVARARRSPRSAPRAFLCRLGASILCISSLIVFAAPAGSEPLPSLATIGTEQPRDVEQSPDGDRIVYSARNCDPGPSGVGSSDCTFEIYSVAIDRGEPQQLLSTYGTDDLYPNYSPDGTEIAFNSWDRIRGCDSHVWVMEADGSNPRMVSSPTSAWDEGLGWSPQGEIAFTRWPTPSGPWANASCSDDDPVTDCCRHADLYLSTRVGEAWTERPVLTRAGSEYDPAFSPNGRRLTYSFDADRDETYSPGEAISYDIWVSRVDGTRHKRLTRTPRRTEWSPAWSPDGKWIAFSRDGSGSDPIWMMRADGSHKRRLTSPRLADYDPAWSPDGTRIAFTRCFSAWFDCGVAVLEVARPKHVEIVVYEKGYLAGAPTWQPR
jgi:Tol biopolymer transport system component